MKLLITHQDGTTDFAELNSSNAQHVVDSRGEWLRSFGAYCSLDRRQECRKELDAAKFILKVMKYKRSKKP